MFSDDVVVAQLFGLLLLIWVSRSKLAPALDRRQNKAGGSFKFRSKLAF